MPARMRQSGGLRRMRTMRIAQKRTLEDTWRHIGDLVATIQPRECSNYFVVREERLSD
ncbi:hypothetical protein [Bradyrhizobium genosp. P]|uniref:hypothetical protein n=1 Tax=Bradyrhizobium genosp. P TaxID=83641 RepID=UPI003CE6C833